MCVFHLLREYWRNLPGVGDYGRFCGGAGAAAVGQFCGRAAYWCVKALPKGLRHLTTGQVRQRTLIYVSLGRWRGRIGNCGGGKAGYGMVWTEHNRLAWQQIQGRLNQTA